MDAEMSIWGFKLMSGGENEILLKILSRSALSKAEAASERDSDSLIVLLRGNGGVGEPSGGIVNTGGLS